jgi:hypothetical protein
MTAPSFVGDTLMISVQRPGERSPIDGDTNAGGPRDGANRRGT